ncbi:ectonucleotide pyrophosphatase/phosphodiesterase [Halobacteriovorax sp. DA5]|uniref:alkaline phosphatase family protein n=1 Tax=Halobacteriovorax sp. DA5 TaxID=2067553 RepID=UPI000CD0FDE9|nr:ectonucleotide pyrophosphatase/phosphodiesterase [Halobacteriovorax sp. DA5]POB12563.1 hypothetical protein C0Z22_14655 [Halobacteriovorax sp. DA5]
MKKLLAPLAIISLFSYSSCTKNDSTYKNSYHIERSSQNVASEEELQNINPVLLISLDGYRYDYTKNYKPKFLTKFSNEGTQLKSLIPSYPTKTFPNHLSIATGSYPMNHGIVANHFYAPDLKLNYSLKDRKAVRNKNFYLSPTIWTAAEEQGLKTATLFWPGSEADISGIRPSYWYDYIHKMPHENRIKQILEWLKLPTKERPYFMTLYFPDVDSAGHHYGTKSKEVKEAIENVDTSLEKLITAATKLVPNLNIIIVSDHGMEDIDQNKKEIILKDETLALLKDDYRIFGEGPIVQFYKKEIEQKIVLDIQATLKQINAKAKNFKCYDKDSIPSRYNFKNNVRIGTFACIANAGWWIAATDFDTPAGSHGWDQFTNQRMHGIFYAQGPDFKKNYIADSKENIHIFPLVLRLLGLDNHYQIDGKIEAIQEVINQ